MSKFALLFLTVFFGGIIAALFYSGISAFLLYEIVYFVNPDTRWWATSIPGLRYSFITVVLMMLALALNYKSYSERSPWFQQPATKWLIALVLMYLFMYTQAIVPGEHQQFTINFIKLIVIILIAYKLIDTPKALDAALWAYIIGAAYIGYVATITGRDWQGRVEGIGMIDTGGDANYTAAALCSAGALLMYYAWMGNKKVMVACALLGALIANGLVLINSRGAFLGTVAGALYFLFYMLFSKHQRKGQRPMAILIVVLGVAGTLYVTDDLFWERMSTLTEVEDGDKSGSHRIDYWMATFDMVRDYPLGVGISGYEALSRHYLPEHYFENQSARAVHSSWFQSLAELGWFGPFLFSCLMLSLYRISKKTKLYLIEQNQTNDYFKVLAIEGGLLAYLVAATFINRFRAEMLFWCVLFVASAANVYYLQHVSSKQNETKNRLRTGRRQLSK